MSFENFPYSNFHELNLDWIVKKIKEAYSPENPPENIVLSINGQTGHVELFTDNFIRLPDVPDNAWNIFRVADDEAKGIQFDGDGAYRIYRDQRYKIYDEDNEPDYPVRSVNGQTGDVQIAIPSALVRSVNGKTGAVITPFTNPNGDILALDTNSPGNRWGMSRQTTAGTASIYVDTSGNTIKAYVSLAPAGGGSAQTFPLLTSADIPESAGVVSINTKTGVVTIYGSDILTTQNGNTTIAQDIESLQNGLNTEVSDRTNAIQDLSSRLNAEIADRQTEDAGIENRLGSAITTETSERTTEDNEINSKINDINTLLYDGVSDVNLWERGVFSSTSGNPVAGNEDRYNRMLDYIPDDCTLVKVTNSNFVMRLLAWENDTFKGIMKENGTIATGAADIKYASQFDLRQLKRLYPTYKYKLVMQKPTATVISLTDAQYVEFVYSTIEDISNQIEELRAEIDGIDATTSITKITLSEVVTLPARFPDTGTDSRIKTTSECMLMELSRPGAQHSNWTIETFDGYLTIAGTIRGLTDITLYMI